MTTNDLWWIAVRGSAAPMCPWPVPLEVMRLMTVSVPDCPPGGQTVWATSAVPGLTSNFRMLFGLTSMEEARRVQDVLVRGSKKAAENEVHRLLTDPAVIRIHPDGVVDAQVDAGGAL